MGRTASFNRQQVLDAARDLFWQQGYEASGISQLEAATGLTRSSLYHAFGSKEGLFLAVIDHYLSHSVRPLLAQLQDPQPSPRALADYLDKLRKALTNSRQPGCLLISAANAPIGQRAAIQEAIGAYHRELEQALLAGLQAQKPNLSPAEAQQETGRLLALVISALALARSAPQQAQQTLVLAYQLALR